MIKRARWRWLSGRVVAGFEAFELGQNPPPAVFEIAPAGQKRRREAEADSFAKLTFDPFFKLQAAAFLTLPRVKPDGTAAERRSILAPEMRWRPT